jgi:hypothetical protein
MVAKYLMTLPSDAKVMVLEWGSGTNSIVDVLCLDEEVTVTQTLDFVTIDSLAPDAAHRERYDEYSELGHYSLHEDTHITISVSQSGFVVHENDDLKVVGDFIRENSEPAQYIDHTAPCKWHLVLANQL